MSEYVRQKGKLKYECEANDLALAMFVDALGSMYSQEEKENIASQHLYEGGWRDMYFTYDMFEDFVIHKDKIYRIVTSDRLDVEDSFFEAEKNEDGTIDFHVLYYNGGCSLDEAIEEAMKNIE